MNYFSTFDLTDSKLQNDETMDYWNFQEASTILVYISIYLLQYYGQYQNNLIQTSPKTSSNSQHPPLTTNKSALQITQAFIYFSNPLSPPINQSLFESHLQKLQNIPNKPHFIKKCLQIIIQRYYEIVNNDNFFKLKESLVIKLIGWIESLVKKSFGDKTTTTNNKTTTNPNISSSKQLQNSTQQSLIIIIWSCITHIKKSTPQTQHKQLISSILTLIQISIDHLLFTQSNFNIQTIYPQISASLMHFVIQPQQINHIIFGKCLNVMGKLLVILLDKKTNNIIVEVNQQNHINKNIDKQPITSISNTSKPTLNPPQKSFSHQFIPRLQSYLKLLTTKLPTLSQIYHQLIKKFVNKIWQNSKNYLQIMCSLSILAQLSGLNLDYTTCTQIQLKFIQSTITQQYIQLLQTNNQNILQRTQILKRLQSMSPYINPTFEQCQYILRKFITQLYLIQNNHSLVIPHTASIITTHLQQLTSSHSFANYPVPINTLLESFNFQCQKGLLQKMPYAQTNLTNITILKKILQNLPQSTTNILLQLLLQSLTIQQDQYMIDMSITKFCQFTTKLLVIYWLIIKTNKACQLKIDIAFGIFQILNSCQVIRILKAGYWEQEALISFTLLICFYCYHVLISSKSNNSQNTTINIPQLKKLKLRLSLLETTINNLSEQSILIKTTCYYILLADSAPLPLGQSLHNLQSTLINRNINNLQFILALIKLCQLSDAETEDLALRFMERRGSQQVLKALLPRLSTQTIRKCMLSAVSQRGKWIHLMLGSTTLLHKKQIKQQDIPSHKSQNFYMNDASNVSISNALGVVLLQLGCKWQHSLHLQNPYHQPAIQLLLQLITLDNTMIFFKIRFIPILKQLIKILQSSQILGILYQKICQKIYHILASIPKQNYQMYLRKFQQQQQINKSDIKNIKSIKNNKNVGNKQQNILLKLLQIIKKKHKYYQINYFTNPTNKQLSQTYDKCQQIIDQLTYVLQIKQQQNNFNNLNNQHKQILTKQISIQSNTTTSKPKIIQL